MTHTAEELRYMQSWPLERKIQETQIRIQAWYDSWTRFEIYNAATGKTRYRTLDTRDITASPKLRETEWIKSAEPGQVYLSFSGGKDSTVLKHIVDAMGLDVPAVFVDTGLEYPEIRQFVKDVKSGTWDCFNTDIEIIKPEMRFDQVVREYGYPVISKEVAQRIYYAKKGANWAIACMSGNNTDGSPSEFKKRHVKWAYLCDAPFSVSHKCCTIMKKTPATKYERETGRKPIIGTMAEESILRSAQWRKVGCNAFDGKRPRSAPLSFWTEQDIFHYIKKFDVPYCPVYGEIEVDDHPEFDGQINVIDYLGCYGPEDRLHTTGCDRTGCMFCMFGAHLESEPNRFQRMKQTHPRQWKYCMDVLGLREVLEYIGVKCE